MDFTFDVADFILALVVVCIGILIETANKNKQRREYNLSQRDAYYRELAKESKIMEKRILEEELTITSNITKLSNEADKMKHLLRELYGDMNPREYTSLTFLAGKKDEISQVERELSELNEEEAKLESIKTEIDCLKQEVSCDSRGQGEAKKLEESISQLELENIELSKQAEASSLPRKRHTEIEPGLLEYLEEHYDELTMDFLQKAFETLLEIKGSDSRKDFGEYLNELKNRQANYDSILTDLEVERKKAEIKLDKTKQSHEEDLESFNELRLEHLFKNTGSRELLDKLKERNRIHSEILCRLKTELELRNKEAAKLDRRISDWTLDMSGTENLHNLYCNFEGPG